MLRQPRLVLFALFAVPAFGAPSKHFFIDRSWLAECLQVTDRLGLARKEELNPLFGEDYPWEPRFDNMYPNVIFDAEEGIYKCWYTPFIVFSVDEANSIRPDKARWHDRSSAVCYAVSSDGLHWRKPMFPEFPFEGHPSNIVCWDAHGAGIIKDVRDPNEGRRYKMLFNWTKGPPGSSMAVAFSRDGIHWGQPQSLPGVSLKADTHNNAIWSPSLNSFLAITRDWDNSHRTAPIGIRLVSSMTSPDFIHWSKPREMLRGIDPGHQTYAMPLLEDSGIFFGFAATIDIKADRVHTELAWSKDFVQWHRVCPGIALIPNGEKGAYDYGCLFPAASPIPTADGIRFYYAGSDGHHGGFRRGSLNLATLRTDGFAGLTDSNPGVEGQVSTGALERGDSTGVLKVALAADVAQGGFLRIEVRDSASGARLGQTVIEGPATLNPSSPLSIELRAADPIQPLVELTFHLKAAALYSLQLR